MPSWDELRARLRTMLPVSLDEPECIGVLCRDPEDEQQTQLVKLEPGLVQGTPWLVISADVCAQAALDLDRALRRNQGMATGAFGLLGDRFVIRHAQPLPTLVWSDLDRALQVIAIEAIRARRNASGGDPRALFAYYAE